MKEVKQNWRSQQPLIQGGRLILPGYEGHLYDNERPIVFDELDMTTQSDSQITMNRPLRAANPLSFDHLSGIRKESLEHTNPNCVPDQLYEYTKIHDSCQYAQTEIHDMLTDSSLELYKDDHQSLCGSQY